MDNFSPLEHLVKLVAENEFYLSFKSPRDVRVLEAMRRVDRRNFIPKEVYTELYSVPLPLLKCLFEAIEGVVGKEGRAREIGELFEAGAVIEMKLEKAKELLKWALNLCMNTEVEKVETKALAYNDHPLEIGYGQSCSQPSLVALVNDFLELERGKRVLEIGAGCLYHAATVERIVGEEGKVFSVECIPELAELAKRNNQNYCEGRIRVKEGDGSLGWREEAPFDRIYLTAGVNLKSGCFKPEVLGRQLKPGGILLYPESSGAIVKEVYDGEGQRVRQEAVVQGVVFVPLKGENV